MAGKESKKGTGSKLILLVEGPTEVEFYHRVIELYKSKHTDGSRVRYEIVSLDGVGNFKQKAIAQFKRIYQNDRSGKKKNNALSYKVFLCFDTDVFQLPRSNISIDWETIEAQFKKFSQKEKVDISVFQIHQNRSIEDWLLHDLQGISRYLSVPVSSLKLTGSTGEEKLQNLFKVKGKFYSKGPKAAAFIGSLNIEFICEDKEIKDELNILIDSILKS